MMPKLTYSMARLWVREARKKPTRNSTALAQIKVRAEIFFMVKPQIMQPMQKQIMTRVKVRLN